MCAFERRCVRSSLFEQKEQQQQRGKDVSGSAGSVWAYSCSMQCEGNHRPHNSESIDPFLTLKGNSYRQHMTHVNTPASGVLTHRHTTVLFPALLHANSPKLHLTCYLGFDSAQLLYCIFTTLCVRYVHPAGIRPWHVASVLQFYSNFYQPQQNKRPFHVCIIKQDNKTVSLFCFFASNIGQWLIALPFIFWLNITVTSLQSKWEGWSECHTAEKCSKNAGKGLI